MPRLFLTKNQNGIVGVGGAVGSISSNTKVLDVSIHELEALRNSLMELESSGVLSWSVEEIPTANHEADGAVFSQVVSASSNVLASPSITVVNTLTDLPSPVGGVITLTAEHTYLLPTSLDLQGSRLVFGQTTMLVGESTSYCKLSSTGLVGVPLITGAWDVTLRFLSIEADVVFSLDATGNPGQVLDWVGTKFENCRVLGTIKNYQYVLFTNFFCFNSSGLTFDGTFSEIGVSQFLVDAQPGSTAITVPATAVVGRFRMTLGAFNVLPGETGINMSAGATIGTESYILQTVAFSGGGAYLSGVLGADNKALFMDCRGIANTGTLAHYFMSSNAVATTIAVQGAFVKIAGSTTPGPYVERFTLTDNRATYIGTRTSYFKVSVTLSFNSGNNQIVSMRIAVNGVPQVSSESHTTTSGSGRSENAKLQTIVQLTDVGTDYIEVWITNSTATTAITVTDLSVIAELVN